MRASFEQRDGQFEKKLTVLQVLQAVNEEKGCSHRTLLRKSLHRLYISISQRRLTGS